MGCDIDPTIPEKKLDIDNKITQEFQKIFVYQGLNPNRVEKAIP